MDTRRGFRATQIEAAAQTTTVARFAMTFIVDLEGVSRSVSATDPSVGRNVQEVLRVVDAL